MPRKKTKTVRRRRVQRGDGFFDDVGNFFRRIPGAIVDGAKKVGGLVRDNKLISRGLSLIPDGRARAAGAVASQLGLGRKRRTRKRQTGGAIAAMVV